MTEETTSATPTNTPVFYLFSFAFTVGGIVESDLTEQESRDKLNQELAMVYGPDAVTVTEFRPATPDEVSEYKDALIANAAQDTDIVLN